MTKIYSARKTDGVRPPSSNLFARNPRLRATFAICSNACRLKGGQIGARGTRVACVYVELGLDLIYVVPIPACKVGDKW